MIRLAGVTVVERRNVLLRDVDLTVAPGEHTALMGPNGAGKTTLLRVVAGLRFPTRGVVEVLGERLGRTDVRLLRRRIGLVSTALGDLLHVPATVERLVAAARFGATAPVREVDEDPDALPSAHVALGRVGAAGLASRVCRTLSQGEWQRVQIARSLVHDPDLLLLDEPMAGLDVGGRERLVGDLDALMREPGGPTVVLVTHHLEEVAPAVERAVLLRGAAVVADGRPADVLTRGPLGAAFGVDLDVRHDRGRFTARLAE